MTVASGTSVWKAKTTEAPATGRELASVSITTSGSGSSLPTVSPVPSPDTALQDYREPSTGKREVAAAGGESGTEREESR